MLLTFYAIKYLPISIAVLLMNTSALFVPLLLFVLRTRTPLNVLACSFLGFAGVSIIMLTDSSKHFELQHIGYALGAAFLAAMAFISTIRRKISCFTSIYWVPFCYRSFLPRNGQSLPHRVLCFYYW